MGQEQLEQFIQRVLCDAALQAQLWATSDVDSFVDLVQRLGAAHGHPFTAADVHAALRASRLEARARGPLTETAAPLAGWVPRWIGRRGAETIVEWCYLGQSRLVEPFFEHSIAIGMRHPLNRLIRLLTPIGVLVTLRETQPGVPAAGFIFHMSRCGSTLIAQLLATLPQAVVLAEAEPIDAVLRAQGVDPTLTEAQRCSWLQATVSALGRRRTPADALLFVKFDSWSVLDLPLIRRAFPDVPWVFVYRDPIEVMVSHATLRGSQMVPGLLPPALVGLAAADLEGMSLDEYCARMLASICGAAAAYAVDSGGQMLDYRRLPAAVWSGLLPLFGVTPGAADLARMQHAGQFHAKQPAAAFVDDTVRKRRAASADLHRLADQWVRPHYEQLLSLEQVS